MSMTDNAANIALCNQALGMIGATEITLAATTEQNYVYCATFFDDARDEILTAHKWNKAKKRAYAIQTTDPLFGYDNAFTYPTDCLKVWMIVQDPLAKFEVEGDLILTDEGETPPAWATATAYIVGQPVTNDDNTHTCKVAHTSGALDDEPGTGAVEGTYWTDNGGDYQVLEVEYVYQKTDVSTWPIFMRRCLILNLGMYVAPPIKQDEKAGVNFQTMLHGSKKVIGYMDVARSIDAQEQGGVVIKTSTWLDSRR